MFARMMVVALAAGFLTPVISSAQNQQLSDGSSRAARLPAAYLRPIPAPPGDGWVWIAPTYRTVYGRIWTEPVYTTVTDTVWVAEQYGWRTVCYWENGQYVQRQEWVVVSPGHYETRTRRELVSPGGWTWGSKLELVTPGHWEWRGTTPPPPPLPPTPYTPAPRPPGLEPFSPLWDWPADSNKK